MRKPSRTTSDASAAAPSRDAESLFRSKPIAEIRNVESTTKNEMESKKEELRQLIGTRYRDLIESADTIILMKSSCESIAANLSAIESGIHSLSSSPLETPRLAPNPARGRIFGIATRVKYLVDTPENIWGCLEALEMKIALPSMPSFYIAAFLFQACQEIHRVGGHVLDKVILQNFAGRLLEKTNQWFLHALEAN